MTMSNILTLAASATLFAGAVPAYTCENVRPDPQFHFGTFIFGCDKGSSVSLEVDSNSVDAIDFLDDLIVAYGLEGQMAGAHRWVAEEFYPGELTLSTLRLRRGFTQAQLAQRIGVPQSTIARLESGKQTPSVDRAGELAHALNVSLDEYYAAFKATQQGKKA